MDINELMKNIFSNLNVPVNGEQAENKSPMNED